MKIAVIGARGMLGLAVSHYFERKGHPVVRISRKEYDIAKDPIRVLEPLIAGCEVIINCAGVIKPMIAQTPIEDVLRVNAVFPRNLAKLASRANARCYHITTDCVYSGSKGSYTELDELDATDVYGMSKNGGEMEACMVLRTSIIGEEQGQSRSLLEWARSNAGKAVNGFTNHKWNGVTTVYLAEIIETIERTGAYRHGIFHVHSPNTLNKFELLSQVNEVYGLDLKITPVEAKERIDRDLASIHPLSRAVSTKTIKEQLADMRAFFSTALPA
jgi:dTDP-4-dehydrorhamnose reductase